MANQMRPLRSSLFYSCCCEMHSKSAILEQAWHSMLMLSEVCPFASSARSSTSTAKCTLPNWCVILQRSRLVVVICIHVNSTCKGTCLRMRNWLLHRPENHWILETQWKLSSHLNPATKLISLWWRRMYTAVSSISPVQVLAKFPYWRSWQCACII